MHAGILPLLLVSVAIAQVRPPQPSVPGTIRKDELEYQQQAFKQWWGDELVTKLVELPSEAKVPEWRVPYSGHDYPDLAGGTMRVLAKYDQAFHQGRGLATEFERRDVTVHRGGRTDRALVGLGLFPRLREAQLRSRVPTWYGHCNGWTAAAIRHAEPRHSVVRNGVVFSPADIKGLLAELYMYSDSEFLGGIDPAINPATLHLSLANWLGRGEHPIGAEVALGEMVVNYPVFAYQSQLRQINERQVEAQTRVTYAVNIGRELDRGPANYHRQMVFHYMLSLDTNGNIRGGYYLNNSQRIDMLWMPRNPAQGGSEGNRRGNPHLNAKEVLAIWRESVPEELRQQWLNIDPVEEDRILSGSTLTSSD